ncbi:MAG: TIGR04255 family protein [Gemmatimonadaceae bacterium]
MTSPLSPLPEYTQPPVSEMVLGVQFEPPEKLGVVHLGLAWQEFRNRYPRVEQQPPLPPAFERFDLRPPRPVRINLELVTGQLLPRLWFITEDGRRLLQVQRDRFIRNWRKMDGREEYPRYRQLRADFSEELTTFAVFLERERLGPLQPNQCEVTYVNELMAKQAGTDLGGLSRVMSTWSPLDSDDFPARLEDVTQEMRYVIPDPDGRPVGRLRVILQPVQSASSGQQAYRLRLTAQGRPIGSGLEGVFRFFDVGHEWAVRCFTAITAPDMHQAWGRLR